MRLALSAFASFIVLLFMIRFYSGIIYVIKVDQRIFLLNYLYSVLNPSPKGSKTTFRLKLWIKGEESCVANYAMIESSLVMSPIHPCEGSLHWFSLNEISLMGWKLSALRLIGWLTYKIVDGIGPCDRSIKLSCFKIIVFAQLINDGKVVSIKDLIKQHLINMFVCYP
jgi:hypothetical protein